MSGYAPDLSGGAQIPRVILFAGLVSSNTRHVQQTTLEADKGIGYVRWAGLALE
jgi:hypothetical protein